MPAHMAMTGYTVAQEALDAWIASHPEPDPLETAKSAKLSGLSAACNSAIVAGCDVTLPSGTSGHIALTDEDQINLTTAVGAVQKGGRRIPLPPGRAVVRHLSGSGYHRHGRGGHGP
ncbi:MAG: hypothetical protein ACLSAF_18170 [Intestinimonas sp.]